jgi:predicted nucleic acid-binding protein
MERIGEQPIIADTSALVSLVTKTDHNHVPAMKAAAELREDQRPIILPSDVLVETVNILGKRSSYETALVETTSHVEAALAKFKEQPEAVSLTDCIVMALADHYSTKDIFGFDKQFEDAGYHRLEPSTEWKAAA